ncbi:MAG: hypothetical protein Q7R69_00115 [bacterium]|nr:hypothetical protein [bacterium]
MKNKSILVVFGEEMPKGDLRSYDMVLSGEELNKFIGPGSIYEASQFAKELSYLKFPDGTRIAKSFIYEGYELWWIHYNSLSTYFCLPYTQYKKLLSYLGDFRQVYFYNPPYKSLFAHYLSAYGCEMSVLNKPGFKSLAILPLGILLQIILTLLSLPFLIFQRRRILVFTGDKFEKTKDYDFRMEFVYRELRDRNLPFVEFIRSLESGKTILEHFLTRGRPVIYSEAVAFVGKFLSFILGSRHQISKQIERDPQKQFKILVATHHLLNVYNDMWAIRIMKWILRVIGVKSAFFPVALERNFHAVLGCKLNNVPTVGLLHGAPSKYYNVYDFMPGFDGEKILTTDKYGLWSDWWKEYYITNSRAYLPEQLYVSGPMRPLEKQTNPSTNPGQSNQGPVKVLFISEQLAAPYEVLPYLNELLNNREIELSIKFRPTKDGFEEWLLANEPEILEDKNLKILRGSITDAVKECDAAVGSHSTAVLEALLEFKIPIFFKTDKWGDCFNMKDYGTGSPLFAENPGELIKRIKNIPQISEDNIKELRERYFGDPYQNGSKWVVDQLEDFLATT